MQNTFYNVSVVRVNWWRGKELDVLGPGRGLWNCPGLTRVRETVRARGSGLSHHVPLCQWRWWQGMGLTLVFEPLKQPQSQRRSGARERYGEEQLVAVIASTMQRISSVELADDADEADRQCGVVLGLCFRTEMSPVPQTRVPISGWSVLGELEDILGWVWGVFPPPKKFSLCAQAAPWCN